MRVLLQLGVLLIVNCVLGLSASGLVISGPAVTWDRLPDGSHFPGTHVSNVTTAVHNGGQVGFATLWFSYTPSTLQVAAFTMGWWSNWWLVPGGAELSAATIASGQFPELYVVSINPDLPVQPIPLGEFYIGIDVPAHYNPEDVLQFGYGWIKLNNTGSDLVMVDNAMAFGEIGIYVGTTTVVPEPAVSVAWMLLLTHVLSRRRVA